VIFLLLIGVIVLWFLALLFWNVSTLKPGTFFSITGLLRLTGGAIFVIAALLLLYLSFPGLPQSEMSWFAIGSFLVALIADFMIGDDIRSVFGRRRHS
jgi:hypothetical protein